MKNKRILWLLNHTTLREFEVPLLMDLGFEVYVPKIFPEDEANRSASITYEYDKTLSITNRDLKILNLFDFYSNEITQNINNIINNNFDVAICAFFPIMIGQLVDNFKGKIFLRVFGIAGNNRYEDILAAINPNLLNKIYKIKRRFFLAQSYPEIGLNENGIFRRNAKTLPLGLPKEFYKNQNSWSGEKKQILFICPRIKSSAEYYGKIYNEFKKFFGDLPHVIGGAQPIEVIEDSKVLGFLSRDALDNLFKQSRVMYYHSMEPRHLHYHPLEAIAFGMPLIFMANGLLESLGGQEQPGMCHSVQEARKKIEQILQGDEKLISRIKEKQKNILEKFSYDFCIDKWKKNFLSILNIEKKEIYKIAIFLPVAYRGGSLRGAKNIAKMILLGAKKDNVNIKVIFSCVKNEYYMKNVFSDLIELGISIRETEWKIVTKEEASIALGYLQDFRKLENDYYVLPYDGSNNFNDCDFWLIISDRTTQPIAPGIKPFGMVIYDYIQRYVPEIFGPNSTDIDLPFILSARNADVVLCTTPQTKLDAIQYAGIAEEKITLIPMEFNPLDCENYSIKEIVNIDEPYMIWTTNTSLHKNHINTLKALMMYYEDMGGKFKVVITGVDTNLLKGDKNRVAIENIVQIREFIQKYDCLRKNIKILGELSDGKYISVLSKAKFLLHPALYDNGTFSVLEAAYSGVPSVSSNYPQMLYMNERFRLGMLFFNPRKPPEIANILKKAELEIKELKQNLPTRDFLKSFTYEKLAYEYWNLLRKNL